MQRNIYKAIGIIISFALFFQSAALHAETTSSPEESAATSLPALVTTTNIPAEITTTTLESTLSSEPKTSPISGEGTSSFETPTSETTISETTTSPAATTTEVPSTTTPLAEPATALTETMVSETTEPTAAETTASSTQPEPQTTTTTVPQPTAATETIETTSTQTISTTETTTAAGPEESSTETQPVEPIEYPLPQARMSMLAVAQTQTSIVVEIEGYTLEPVIFPTKQADIDKFHTYLSVLLAGTVFVSYDGINFYPLIVEPGPNNEPFYYYIFNGMTIEVQKFWNPSDQASVDPPFFVYEKVPSNTGSLTIRSTGLSNRDANQTIVYEVTGPGADAPTWRVAIQGNTSRTLTGLPPGSYTIQELTDWSWRYHVDSITPTLPTVTFAHTRANELWFSGDSYAINRQGMAPIFSAFNASVIIPGLFAWIGGLRR
ncbi:MAG: hypothetical protein EOM03_06180 [Clostridia bacterium]|nr:hypothetical protein [Clostridia bacterium]